MSPKLSRSFFQAEDGIRDRLVTGVQTCALPIFGVGAHAGAKFGELNAEHKLKIGYDPFNAGSKVNDPDKIFMKLPHMNILNKDHFSNLKAQSWDEVAAR